MHNSMFLTVNRQTTSLLVVLACLGVSGCGSLPDARNKVSPYKIDVVQGNVVTREQLAVIKPGMPRMVVRDVLGTPLLSSVFHGQRWDYVFSLQRQGELAQSRRVTVFFAGEVVERIEADELPSESEFVATLKSPVKAGPIPPLEASPESLKKFEPATKSTAPVPLPPAAPRNYPPLEPAGN